VGCKVLYESLANLNDIESDRLLRPIDEITDVTDSVMLLTNVRKISALANLAGLKNYLQRGGNILIFTKPLKLKETHNFMGKKIDQTAAKTTPKSTTEKKLKKTDHIDKNSQSDDSPSSANPTFNKLLSSIKLTQRDHPYRMPILAQPDEQLKALALPEIAIYSHGYLKFTSSAWQPLYQARLRKLLATAQYGRGTIIVSATSYFISNEAMLKKPSVKLLSWLIGDRHRVIFNELIHDQANRHNIAWLVGKYRLSILLFNLLLVIVLFIWKSFFSTVNYQQEEYQAGSVHLSSTFGLAKLLRKNISPRKLLTTCLTEWRKERIMTIGKHSDAELLAATDPKGRQLKTDYNNIVELINKTGDEK
jgi:hypothetical protein